MATNESALRGCVESKPESETARSKLTLLPLIALVVGSMVGGGVFNLPSDMSKGASPGAILIGWVISGLGMLMLALVYQRLAIRKPELNAGPYAYAKAGFGSFVGFNSAWGYWLCAFLANVAYAVAIFSALSNFFPVFGDGNNFASIAGASICLWLVHALVLRGIKQAAFVNVVTTIAKLVPLLLFVLLAIVAFNWDKFTFDFWGHGDTQGQRRSGLHHRPGQEHDARDALGVHRYRGRQRLLRACGEALGRGQGDATRLRRRTRALCAGLATRHRHPHAATARRVEGAVVGGRVRAHRRFLGHRTHRHRTHGLGGRRVPVLDPVERGGPLHLRSRWDVPQVVRGRERQRLAEERALGHEHP